MHPCPSARQSWASVALTVAMAISRAHGFQLPITSTSTRLHGSPLEMKGLSTAENHRNNRREIIQQSSAAVIASLLLPISSALASESSEPYTRTSPNDKFKFSYTVTPPPLFVPGNKPLKTHLDEINFSPPDVRGYTLGITVDPVRISKIQEFGTPEEVAARVVTAEINRDGVFKVTLAKDPSEDSSAGCYDIEYIADGKRGTKRNITRIYIQDGFLYVLTAQSKEAEFDKVREADVAECVKSFRPL